MGIAIACCAAVPAVAQDLPQPLFKPPMERLNALEKQVIEQKALIEQLTEQLNGDGTEFEDNKEPDKALMGITSRVDRLEEQVIGFEEKNTNFMESLSNDSRRRVNGRIHIDHWSFPDSSEGINLIENGNVNDAPQSRFLYRRLRIGVAGEVQPLNTSYRLEIEFSGQDGSQFRDAWIGWDDLALFETIRLGNQKRPYGLDHLNSSNFNIFLERPFVVDGFNEDNRRFGLVSYGITDDLSYNWRYGIYEQTLVQDAGAVVGDRIQPEFAGRLASTWWYDDTSNGRGYGHFALAGTLAYPYGDAPNDGVLNNAARFRTRPEGRSSNRWLNTGRIARAKAYQILALESVFNVGAFQATAEYMNLWLQRTPDADVDENLMLHGGYLYLSYFLTGEHIPWNRGLGILGRVEPYEPFFSVRDRNRNFRRGWGAWQIAMRLSYADFNDSDIFGGYGRSTTFALNWHWNAHSKLTMNYTFGSVDNKLVNLDSGGTTLASGPYQMAGARFIIDF